LHFGLNAYLYRAKKSEVNIQLHLYIIYVRRLSLYILIIHSLILLLLKNDDRIIM